MKKPTNAFTKATEIANSTNERDGKEMEEMVKKASTITSLDDLKINGRTKAYLNKKFSSIDEIILFGRAEAYRLNRHPEARGETLVSTIQLIDALTEAGYVRNDIDERVFGINWLYNAVFFRLYADYYGRAHAPRNIMELSAIDTEPYQDFRLGNERYEYLHSYDESQIKIMREVFKKHLSERANAIMNYRIGLDDGKLHSLEETGKRFIIAQEYVRHIEIKSFRILRGYRDELPKILGSANEWSNLDSVISELRELRQNPVFQKEAELKAELFAISRSPFSCALDAKRYLKKNIPVNELGLSARTTKCLERAQLATVADICSYPMSNIHRVRNLGRKGAQEIIDKMNELGFSEEFYDY